MQLAKLILIHYRLCQRDTSVLGKRPEQDIPDFPSRTNAVWVRTSTWRSSE
jgi:hypothetical protein